MTRGSGGQGPRPAAAGLRPAGRRGACPAALRLLAAAALLLLLLGAPVPCATQLSCSPGSYASDDGSCVSCPAGSACAGGTATPMPCDPDFYADAEGQAECSPCPDSTYAHFSGSTGCLACYFGQPVVVVGLGATQPPAPPQQATAGFRTAILGPGLDSCAFSSPFRPACSSTAGRTVVVEALPSCLVQLYVLGDPQCSYSSGLTVVEGAYRDIYTVQTLPDEAGGYSGSRLTAVTAPQPGKPGLSLSFTNAAGGEACTSRMTSVSGGNCPPGTAPASRQSLSGCRPCDAGQACPGGAAAASTCLPGSFSEVVGATACLPCPNGTVTAAPGSTYCLDCGSGMGPSPDRTTCIGCPGGTYSKYWGQPCLACPAGQYRPDAADGGGDGSECLLCPPGSSPAADRKSCDDCGPGTYADNEGTPQCLQCPAGMFAAGHGSQECNQCEPGSFSSSPGADQCTLAGAGQYTINPGGVGATKPTPCPKGTWKAAEATDNKCQMCPSGYATGVELGASSCKPCPPGFYAPQPNSVSCLACGPGTYTSEPGQKSYKLCAAGQVSTGNITLSANVDGSFGNASATASTTCQPCPSRTFRPSIYAANVCTVCPAGRETRVEIGASTCTACLPGASQLGGSWNCSACAPGQYSDSPGWAGQCPLCPAGSAVSDFGNQLCDVCMPGTYQDQDGQLSCIDCPVGTYTEMTGARSPTDCRAAPPGNFAAGTGNDGFTPCPPGTYQNQAGQGACKSCPPGNACPAGAVRPQQCNAGFFADMKQPYCRECAKGTFQDRPGQRACKPCPAGAYCPATKTIKPTLCPAGTYSIKLSAAVATACTKCPVNSFSAATGSTMCSRCPTGQWTGRLTGQKLCWPTSQPLPNTTVAKRLRR